MATACMLAMFESLVQKGTCDEVIKKLGSINRSSVSTSSLVNCNLEVASLLEVHICIVRYIHCKNLEDVDIKI